MIDEEKYNVHLQKLQQMAKEINSDMSQQHMHDLAKALSDDEPTPTLTTKECVEGLHKSLTEACVHIMHLYKNQADSENPDSLPYDLHTMANPLESIYKQINCVYKLLDE